MVMKVRRAIQEDHLDIHKFTAECPPLENYPEHVYKIILRYFGNYCFIIEENGKIIAFVMGIVPQTLENTYFLWDIGIDPCYQKQGIGARLLNEVEKELTKLGFRRIEVTIDPTNIPSQKLFEKMGYQNISKREGRTIITNGNLAVEDFYSPGRHFMLYEKRLIEI